MVSHEDVRQLALTLPESTERASYGGRPSWRTKTKMFSWIRENPEALVVWVGSLDEKEAMIESQPKKFFTIPHYDGEPIVLVRLESVGKKELKALLIESWCQRASKTAVKDFRASQAR